MDEIEAALDEANVTRYVQYMRRLAKNTQFLVITHRRGTMEEADHLFGVTMQEKACPASSSFRWMKRLKPYRNGEDSSMGFLIRSNRA